jgi:hypothetical protein
MAISPNSEPEPSASEGSGPAPESRRAGFLLGEFNIGPALEELRRLYEKKLRSFETSEDERKVSSYRRAFALGEEKILRRLEEGERC